MTSIAADQGRWVKTALATLAAGAMTVPPASAWATGEDPAQPATPAAAAAPLTDEQVALARETFNSFACGACHALGDAAATGQVGPALDGNGKLDHALIVDRVAKGQGAMPGFRGQIPDEDIAVLASYVMQVKK